MRLWDSATGIKRTSQTQPLGSARSRNPVRSGSRNCARVIKTHRRMHCVTVTVCARHGDCAVCRMRGSNKVFYVLCPRRRCVRGKIEAA